jgi:DNA modification methylase
VVTSPPYWGLRDYGVAGQLGLEPTIGFYVEHMVEVFREVRRVLRDDGTLWLNLGDSYASSWSCSRRNQIGNGSLADGKREARPPRLSGLKGKDLCGIPWRVAFALQDDGWFLRQDIIWSKLNPMPESVTDRCTKAHEYVFLLSRNERYFYDATAIAEPSLNNGRVVNYDGMQRNCSVGDGVNDRRTVMARPVEVKPTRNKRSVWDVATESFLEAHFATMPTALVEPCILAGCPKGGMVLDPFAGAGTVGLVADRLQRDAVLIELNPQYAEMAERRIAGDAPLFTGVRCG